MSVVNRLMFKQLSKEVYQKFTNSASQKLKLKSPRRIIFFNSENQYSSTNQTHSAPSKNEQNEMMVVWHDIIRDLNEHRDFLDLPGLSEWMTKIMQYTIPYSRRYYEELLVQAYRVLAPPDQLTEENIRLARILSWCIDLKHYFILLTDDIVDQSTTRSGKLCWYLQNGRGLGAINDGILMEQAIYQLLRMYFKDKPCYVDLIEIFHDIMLKTVWGQIRDTFPTSCGERPNFSFFTMEQYNMMVKAKAEYTTHFMAFTLAMNLAGVADSEIKRQTAPILFEMGNLFQVQDDYLDIYGNPTITGKIRGMDIRDGKASWPAVAAYERATPSQRKIFEEYYAYNDEGKVARIIELYDDIGIPKIYEKHEDEKFKLMKNFIEQMTCGLPHDFFDDVLSKLYRRQA